LPVLLQKSLSRREILKKSEKNDKIIDKANERGQYTIKE
jgi:hypothetical protein